jgi:hypothetical protein
MVCGENPQLAFWCSPGHLLSCMNYLAMKSVLIYDIKP